MSTQTLRRGAAVLVASGALLTVTFAAAAQADAATIYVCVKKKSGAVRFVNQKTKCRKSESKRSWNTSGANGANGAPGANGAAGAIGKEGPAGKDVPTVLAPGKSERGYYATWGVGGGYLGTSITFQIPLSAALDETHVHFVPEGTSLPPACPGKASAPTATSGNLCVYETNHGGTTFGNIFPESTGSGTGADLDGFGVYFNAGGTTGVWDYGSWAVTG